jgi:hypothetical protein
MHFRVAGDVSADAIKLFIFVTMLLARYLNCNALNWRFHALSILAHRFSHPFSAAAERSVFCICSPSPHSSALRTRQM